MYEQLKAICWSKKVSIFSVDGNVVVIWSVFQVVDGKDKIKVNQNLSKRERERARQNCLFDCSLFQLQWSRSFCCGKFVNEKLSGKSWKVDSENELKTCFKAHYVIFHSLYSQFSLASHHCPTFFIHNLPGNIINHAQVKM